jgi:hypothetical protein
MVAGNAQSIITLGGIATGVDLPIEWPVGCGGLLKGP